MTRPLPPSTALLFPAVVMSAIANAQDFAPFNTNSRKLFARLDHAYTYSLVFDSAVVNGDTTAYYNFSTVSDALVPSNCPWWVGQECWPMDKPTWAGARIDVATDGAHSFHSSFAFDEAVNVAFSTEPGSQTIMYASIDQVFLMAYDGTSTMDILGQTEQVRQWTILHEDQFGNTISSALNGAHIRVGETIGLISFFRVDSFPLVLEPLELVGQTSPALGLYEITPAVLEDHQPGDEVQFHETYFLQGGPPWNNYDRYRKYVYLVREDTPDAVQYTTRQELFNAGESDVVVDTITLSYDRVTVIGSLPFERFDGTQPALNMVDYCGLGLWTYRTYPNQGLAYCAEENCWGPYDTNGPPPMGDDADVVGLGQFHYWSYIFGPNGYSRQHDIVYFKKNGTECFHEVLMGSAEVHADASSFSLSPNPTDGFVSISSQKTVLGAEVINMHGQLITNPVLDAQHGTLDMRPVANGLYLVRLRFVDGDVGTQRLVVGR